MTVSTPMAAPPATSTGRGKPKDADVFVGFMDEEVNDLLRELRRKFKDRPVVVVERAMGARLELGSLFETPTKFYGEGQAPDLRVHRTDTSPQPDTYEGELASELARSLDGAALGDKLMFGKTKTADEKGKIDPTLLVARFDHEKNVGADPVILVRCPEMGLQPELVQDYLTTILTKIKASVHGDVRLHMFGAGGAIGAHLKPGSKSRIVGSLFLGAEFFKKSDRELAYRPAIKLISMNRRAEFTYGGVRFDDYPFQLGDADASKAARETAETVARQAFSKGAADGRLVSATGQTLDEAARELIEASGSKDGTISLNVSFFGGAQEKQAGRQVGTNRALGVGLPTSQNVGPEPLAAMGLSDVNMEDYHVLVAARAAGIKPEHIRLERVNADPHFIPHEVEARVDAATRAMRMSPEDYVQALLWGFEGSDTSLAPDAASWGRDVFDPHKSDDWDMMVPATRVGENKERPLMLNMFFGEIASDFVTAILEPKANKSAFSALRRRYEAQLAALPEIKDDVLLAFDRHVSLIMGAALAVAASAQAGVPNLEAQVKDLVDLLGRLEFEPWSETGHYLTTRALAKQPTGPLVRGPANVWFLPLLWDPESGESGRMKVWARPSKCGSTTVDELKLSPEDIDRILYKGSNRPALKLWAPKFVEQQVQLIAKGSLLARDDRNRELKVPASVQQLELVAERHARKVEGLHRRQPGAPQIHRKSSASGVPVSSPLVLGSSGAPLPPNLRETLEGHFKRDLSNVVVHTDSMAGTAARSIGAKAFTSGNHVYFAPGQYRPETREGLGLIGHEVAHVDQFQRGLIDASKPHPKTSAPGGIADSLERAADAHAMRVSAKAIDGTGVGRGPLVRAASSAQAFSTAHAARIQRKPLIGGVSGGGESGGGRLNVGMRAGRRGTTVRQLVVVHTGSPAEGIASANPSLDLVQRAASPLAVPLGRGGLIDAAAQRLQRKGDVRAAGGGGGMAPENFGALLGASSGSMLPASVNSRLGAVLGRDFSDVRIHTGDNAASAARSINAMAFTHGRDIYFGAGQYDPNSARGLALIGHELTHVAQGSGGARSVSAKDIRRRQPTNFQSNKAYWERVGVEGLQQGGTWGTTKAVVASLFAGFNDPFGELRRDADPFADALANASGRYPGTLTFDDPQRRSWQELKQFFGRTGDAAFNRAPARGKIPSGQEATSALEAWMKIAVETGKGTTLEEVIYQAIAFNGGNVTLAMGSIAEILCKGKNRRWAARISGLHNNGKDYYIFAGAYVGLQPTLTERLLGWAGSHGNIGGNPIAYSAGGALQYGAAWLEDDNAGMKQAKQLMTSRWGLEDNYNKFHEFNTGFLGATQLQRKGYEVAGHDGLEQQALANERAIMRAFSGGTAVPQGQPTLLALGASTKVARRTDALMARSASKMIARRTEGALIRRAEETPVTDRWWSRHAVGAWGVGRALYDFFKPGSKRFEEMRGDVTTEIVTKLKARLDERRGSVVWTPFIIYTEARALTQSRREALQLAFALLVEHHDIPLAPMPGIDAEEPLHDKYEHFFASAIMAHRSNAMGSFTVGWLKEVGDQFGTGYSEPDLMADALGAEFGQNLQSGEPAGETFYLQNGGRRTPRQLVKPGKALRRALAGRDPLEDLADELDPRAISRALREPGLPLEQALREKVERGVGADLGNVRVHTGEVANRLARSIGAEAFTIGTDIFLGETWRGADSVEGVGTLVHEATHVAQANQGRLDAVATPARTRVLETEAYAHERAFLQGAPAPTAGPTRAVARPIAAAPRTESRPGPDLVMREAPRGEDVPAPEVAPMPTRVLKKVAKANDPIQRVMDTWAVGADLSREEFLETCTERVLELMREELEGDAERGATNMAWSYDLPMS